MSSIINFLKELKLLCETNRKALIGITLLAIPLAMAIAPQLIAPYNPYVTTGAPFEKPSWKHILGTNDIGQDLFSELVYGARITLLVGFSAAVSATLIGTIVGLFAGYYGGVVDYVLTSITDTMLLLPMLPLMVLLASILGQGYQNIVLVLTIFSWPGVARVIRSQVISVKSAPYVEAAKAIGAGDLRIMFKHILPQLVPIQLAYITLSTGGAMLAEAALSFLGLGNPTQKSWGMMIYWAQRTGAITSGAWWWIIAPGIMITVSVLGFALIGYALEEYFNPKLRTL